MRNKLEFADFSEELDFERDCLLPLWMSGEDINPAFIDKINNNRLISPLAEAIRSQPNNLNLLDFIKHSNRFSNLNRFSGIFDRSERITINQSEQNLHQNGRPRQEESGYKLNFDYIKDQNIDPGLVLYFRVTQPSEEPKPEWYWTSDFAEVNYGLGRELGNQESTAVILVSTLEEISGNGGLINDVNDDSGIALRQIGLDVFDQIRALTILPREHNKLE